MGIETAIITAAVIGAAATATSVGVSAASQRRAEKKQKNIAEDARNKADQIARETKEAAAKAELDAKEEARKKRAALTQTILTTPLGVSGGATVKQTTLGSAG